MAGSYSYFVNRELERRKAKQSAQPQAAPAQSAQPSEAAAEPQASGPKKPVWKNPGDAQQAPGDQTARPVTDPKKDAPPLVPDGRTKAKEEKEDERAARREEREFSRETQLEVQKRQQDFAREQADTEDRRWYARQQFLQDQKNVNKSWSFRGTSTGMSTHINFKGSTWSSGDSKYAPRSGRIGEDFGRGGHGSKEPRPGTMEHDIWERRQQREAKKAEGLSPKGSGDAPSFGKKDPSQPETVKLSADAKPDATERIFDKETQTEVTIPGKDGKGDKPFDYAGNSKDANGVSLDRKIEIAARAAASGAKVQIGHQGVDALGRKVNMSVSADAKDFNKPTALTSASGKSYTPNASGEIVFGGTKDAASAMQDRIAGAVSDIEKKRWEGIA